MTITRSRNEALDCNVYALAAMKLLNPDLESLAASMRDVPRTEEKSTTDTKRKNQPWIPRMDNWLKR
jgi:phage terminase large subunit GpA-like protein